MSTLSINLSIELKLKIHFSIRLFFTTKKLYTKLSEISNTSVAPRVFAINLSNKFGSDCRLYTYIYKIIGGINPENNLSAVKVQQM